MFKNCIYSFLVFISLSSFAQEGVKPLSANINYLYGDLKPVADKQSPLNNINKVTSLTLPFIDDFSYSSIQSYPSQTLWSDSSTYINSGFAIAPPSIGVATFDGLNKRGYPYTPNLANMSSSLPADTLTSKAINLSSFALTNDTSLALTFYYQARGNGDPPEITDSLLVDYFAPIVGKWKTVWFQRGNTSANTNDTMFKRAFIVVKDTTYLHDGFKFRFRNKATTAGDFDHWNVDYVYLNNNRNSFLDTTYNDYSIGYIPSPFIKNYAAMPWRQYDTNDMVNKNTVFIRNNGTGISTIFYQNNTYDKTNTLAFSYGGGSYPNLGYFKTNGWLNHPAMSNPTYTYNFPVMSNTQNYRIKHFIYRSSPDFIAANDTVIQKQTFSNYYAFDDGSAEGGYYVNAVGGKMAGKYALKVSDTLRAVRIYFDPNGSLNLAVTYSFNITIWQAGPSGPTNTVLHRDSVKTVNYSQYGGFNTFSEYALTNTLVLSPGTYYIGIQQRVATGIVVGFDKNIDHSSSLYYDSGNGWTQSSIRGAIMIRPVFGTDLPLGVKENSSLKTNLFSIYPNPSADQFMISSEKTEKASYILMNSLGQKVAEARIEDQLQTVNTQNLSNGIYFLILKINDRLVQQQKIIIQH
ncbi:MAG: T9SS type A sorting domain-containing protein [Bacteroidetes bacterium]|nr:T9SS type A sorting domain-containing protein [Bacteroidota bacterium]